MSVVIIGAGNVATVFGRLIKSAGHEILQVVSRNIDHARWLATELGCAFSNDMSHPDPAADLYLIAISDTALAEITGDFPAGKLIVHTAGSVSKDILENVAENYGVIYPLQSLRKEAPGLHPIIPVLIDGNSETALSDIEKFAVTISPAVSRANDAQRLKLHLAAVIVNNFTNHLYTLAADYCTNEGLQFSMLQPLIEETALRLRNHRPADMQTGPANRSDLISINKHIELLHQAPELKKIYAMMTESIASYK